MLNKEANLKTQAVDASVAMSATPAEQEKTSKTFMGFDILLVKAVIFSVIISSSAVFAYDRYFAFKLPASDIQKIRDIQPVIKADFDVYMQKQADDFKKGKITEKQVLDNLDDYRRKLDAVPKDYLIFTMFKGELFVRNAHEFKP